MTAIVLDTYFSIPFHNRYLNPNPRLDQHTRGLHAALLTREYKMEIFREQTVSQTPSPTRNSSDLRLYSESYLVSRHSVSPQPDRLTDFNGESRSIHSSDLIRNLIIQVTRPKPLNRNSPLGILQSQRSNLR